ncbi:MAG: ATP-dependent RecD-like DNA helicase [Myxococcota bacterium]
MADPNPPQARLDLVEPPPPEVEGVLEGEVTAVTYANETSGFRVLRVKPTTGGPPVAVVGVLPTAPPGTRVRATGAWEDDRKHGRQFKAETLLTLEPNTLEGVRRYLGSGLVPGIGPAYARRIVDVFGPKTLEVLDRNPEKLAAVPGLGKARIASVADAWRSHRDVGAIMVFLQAHGASPALAARIHKRFGKRALHIVSTSPYRLALDVWGIGFATADQIARRIGVGANSPERAQAGVLQTLHDVAGRGDVFAPHSDLVTRACELLGCGPTLVEDAIAELEGERRLVVEPAGGGPVDGDDEADAAEAVYTPELLDAERGVAARVGALVASVERIDHVDHALADFERRTGLTLAPAQRQAVAVVAEHKVVVITGGPGVGKTTVVRAVLALFDAARAKVHLGAPTGRAAKRMSEATGREAKTLHRLLEFDPKDGGFQRHRQRPLENDVLVVDEASMVPLELAHALFDAVPGHARVVLVGDVDQLPSVGPGAVLRDLIASEQVPTVMLTQIFRQAEGSGIVENAHRIHAGEMPEGGRDGDAEFFVIPRSDPERAVRLIEHLVTERIPRRFGFDPVRDIQILTPMQKGMAGALAINERLQHALNPVGPEVRRGARLLRQGDKVMQLRNNYDKEVFNGDIGQIDGVDVSDETLTVDFDGKSVTYGANDLDELTLAYATSIHKSQGSEYPAVVLPILTQHFVMLSRNLLYTGVTRGKRLVVLVADPRALRIALGETRKERRRTRLAARLRGAFAD